MKIIKIKAGLGNQLFQYSFGKLLEREYGETVCFDLSYFDKWPHLLTGLQSMNAPLPAATQEQLKSACLFRHTQTPHTLRHRVPVFLEAKLNKRYYLERSRAYVEPETVMRYTYLDGYWQSWRYLKGMKDPLRDDFSVRGGLSREALRDIDAMRAQESVCVGLRLGDYQGQQAHYHIPAADYYIKSIQYMESKLADPVFYVFSNNIDGAKALLAGQDTARIVFRESAAVLPDHEELWVMEACRHAVTPNSTFHWWAAWLKNDPGGIVIAPQQWFADGSAIDIIPPGWIRI